MTSLRRACDSFLRPLCFLCVQKSRLLIPPAAPTGAAPREPTNSTGPPVRTLNPVNPVNPVKKFSCLFTSFASFCDGTRPQTPPSQKTKSRSQKKSRLPLDTQFIVVYLRDSSMDTANKWVGKRHKTREPIRRRERSRRTVSTFRAPRSNVLTFPGNVTAELRIFSTFSPSHFENTHHRPLPLNHLRKMQEKTVQFRVDIAIPPLRFTFYALRAAFRSSTHCHRRIAPFLHRFCTVFRFHFSLPTAPQPLTKPSPPKWCNSRVTLLLPPSCPPCL